MPQTKHFIIFQRTDNHCATWLVRAATLGEAMLKFGVREGADTVLLEDGSISCSGCGRKRCVYTHPLEYIESENKSSDGLWGQSLEIKELREEHWQANFSEVFCSNSPGDVEDYIKGCRPKFRETHLHSNARAFIWYLKTGPLITFHRRKVKRCPWPIEVLGRYHLLWETWPQAVEWHGTLDDILEQMSLEILVEGNVE